MTIIYHDAVVQGSEEWAALRCGILTASEMKLIVTPPPGAEERIKKDGTPYKPREWNPIARNDKEKAHLFELLAQRITRYVEPRYISDDMLRGQADEIEARALYVRHFAPVTDVGFVTNDEWGFTIGYSPDGLVADDGLIECKSRRQRFQVETVINAFMAGTIDPDYVIQAQTGLLVTRRPWLDHISYSGGLPMTVVRVYPDEKVQAAIILAATDFEERLADNMAVYDRAIAAGSGLRTVPTERRIEMEMYIA